MEFAKILKANPYHDEKGRFSTEDKAKFVSTGGIFDKQRGKNKESDSGVTFSDSETKTGLKALEELPFKKYRTIDGMKEIKEKAVPFKGGFGFGNGGILPTSTPDEKTVSKVKTVDLGDLIATQDIVDPKTVKEYLNGTAKGFGAGKLPVVLKAKDGKLYISDGHHRLTAQVLAGRKKAKVRYAEVDSVSVNAAGTEYVATYKSDASV